MKKILLILIILIGWIYIATGRYVTTESNIKNGGWGAIIDEPVWLINWTGEKVSGFVQGINHAIDNAAVSTKK